MSYYIILHTNFLLGNCLSSTGTENMSCTFLYSQQEKQVLSWSSGSINTYKLNEFMKKWKPSVRLAPQLDS